MDISLTGDLWNYASLHTSDEPEHLRQIREETERAGTGAQMVSGHYQGRLLALLSKMIRPSVVLETGTFTGYSALCFAEGLAEGGKVITIERNATLEPVIRHNLSRTPLGNSVDLRIGEALQVIPTVAESPDLVFLDADKKGYTACYELLLPRMRSGAWLLADNVLWKGKVLDASPDERTKALMAFNTMVQNDARVEQIMLPVRDGILLIRKR